MKVPDSFFQNQAQGVSLGQRVAQFEIGSYRNFVYLIIDWPSRVAAIVDPQTDLKPIYNALRTHQLELTSVLLTHTHHDHIAGVPGLLKRWPSLPVWVHDQDRKRLGPSLTSTVLSAQEGTRIQVGSFSAQVLHTPGHSAGELCYFLDGSPPFLLTGDTVFIRDCGRTDLESGNTAQMFESLQRIRKLPPQTVILPGHHYQPECASLLAWELEKSPPFQCKSVQELEALP